MRLDQQTAAEILEHLGRRVSTFKVRPVSGGDIAQACLLETGEQFVFVKTLPLDQAELLAAETDGLASLRRTQAVRVPAVLGQGETAQLAWMALEALELRSRSSVVDARLGKQLADLHRHSGQAHGWQQRRRWYQLYHLLNHANLFGSSYLSKVRRELTALCRQP